MWLWIGVAYGALAVVPGAVLVAVAVVGRRRDRRQVDEFTAIAGRLADVAEAGRRIASADLYLVPSSTEEE